MTASCLYLAYGSNLHPLRLAERVPSARFEAVVSLPEHRLRFHKIGQDGSGKCNLEASSDPGSGVLAVVYSLDEAEVPMLDRFEGGGYEHRWFEVDIGGEHCSAYAYVAPPNHCDPALKPFRWYRELVLLGARHHRFPETYLQVLAEVDVMEDQDAHRQAIHQALLANIQAGLSAS